MSLERTRRMISSPSQQVSAVGGGEIFTAFDRHKRNTKESHVKSEARPCSFASLSIAEQLRPVLEKGLNDKFIE